jgi:hypothetical protein
MQQYASAFTEIIIKQVLNLIVNQIEIGDFLESLGEGFKRKCGVQ